MTQTARQGAIAKQDQQISDNVDKIEAARRPNALELVAARLNISPASLSKTLRATVFAKANDDEFAALMVVSNEYKLNPLTKEIYAFPAKGGGIVPIVSIDGWIRIANEHPQMDGFEWEQIADNNGKLIASECTIWRKDRSRPIKHTAYLEECQMNTDPWKKMPSRMLDHKAFIQCARYAFGFSGIYDEEGEQIGEIQIIPDTPAAPMRSAKPKELQHDGKRTVEDEETARRLDAEANGEKFDAETGEVIQEQTDERPVYQDKVEEWLNRLGSDQLFAPEIKVIETAFVNDRVTLTPDEIGAVEAAIQDARKRMKNGGAA